MKKNKLLRNKITEFKQQLSADFNGSLQISNTMLRLVNFMDEVIIHLFKQCIQLENCEACLIAVGSFGRRELILHSDIDVLILYSPSITQEQFKQLQEFIRNCWDVGLNISHQITTPSECALLAQEDLTVISTILDSRVLCGKSSLLEELHYQTHPCQMWSSVQFFEAKLCEQQKRNSKYNNSAYNLEPDIKSGPGGLRDLQTLHAVSKRHYRIKKLADCINVGFLTEKEYEVLNQCQNYLWRIRFALHCVAKKAEERLLFDHQMQIAKLLEYHDDEKSLGIEKFMKHYFQVIKTLREFNEIFLQLFKEIVIYKEKQRILPINREFQLSNGYLEVTSTSVFTNRPSAIIDVFNIMAENPEIKGVRANTIRLLRKHKYLIDDKFRNNAVNNQSFLRLLKSTQTIDAQLKRMNRYGILGQYIPAFNSIIGQMQYDLYHVYTVDQHTLFVIQNIVKFQSADSLKKFPLYGCIAKNLLKPYLLIIAALFHDIAKGRGGDHSELGAQDCKNFCQQHHLAESETLLVEWLVKYHLLMSKTAQQQDIYDPLVVAKFCECIPKSHYIDYLYCLTVADICATNENLWNSWKDSLLRELYQASKNHMEQKLDTQKVIDQRKLEAKKQLLQQGLKEKAIDHLWKAFKGKYFLHESSKSIVRQTQAILNAKQYPLILIMPHHSEGGTEVFIYIPHREDRFIIATTILSNHQMTIQESRITSCKNQFDLDIYIILDEKNKPITNSQKMAEIQKNLEFYFSHDSLLPNIKQRRLTRQQAHFIIQPTITFNDDFKRSHTHLFLITADKPGLLANISRIFSKLDIELINAKIATAGERVEDMFIITNDKHQPLTDEQKIKLKAQLNKILYL